MENKDIHSRLQQLSFEQLKELLNISNKKYDVSQNINELYEIASKFAIEDAVYCSDVLDMVESDKNLAGKRGGNYIFYVAQM